MSELDDHLGSFDFDRAKQSLQKLADEIGLNIEMRTK